MLEKKLLNSLVKVSESLYAKYQKLGALEIEGKVNSNEYKKTVENISDLLTFEKEILAEIESNDVDFNLIHVMLFEEYMSDKDYVAVVNRISRQLTKFYDQENEIEEEDDEYFYELFPEIPEDDIRKMFVGDYLVRLQKRINFIEEENIKEALIKSKYDSCFENPDFDKDLVTTRFNVNNLNVSSVKNLFDEAGVKEIDGLSTVLEYFRDGFWETINELVANETYDDEVMDKWITFNILDLQLELFLSYLDFRTIYELQEQINNSNIPENSTSFDIIRENFEEALIHRVSHKGKIEKAFGDVKIKIIRA